MGMSWFKKCRKQLSAGLEDPLRTGGCLQQTEKNFPIAGTRGIILEKRSNTRGI